MKVYHGLSKFERLGNAVVTSGTFDGVHFGHRKILNDVRERADRTGAETVLLTFWPHPRLVLFPEEQDLQLLSTIDEKIELINGQGIDHMVILEFTREFSEMSSQAFIEEILVKAIGTSILIIGYDHKFGKNREGSFENLQRSSKKYNFEVEEIPKQEIDDVAISSTKIRKAVLNGEVATATEFLCAPYSLTGKVVRGKQIGRTIGCPTANIEVPEEYKLIPSDGVYAVEVLLYGKKHKGMLNIGHRPTFSGQSSSIEVHIFDFNQEIYGEHLTVYFHQYIRNELKFKDVNELKQQLATDKDAALKLLGGLKT